MKICVLFPRLRPIAYHKDVGQIPLTFARDLGWNACLVYTRIESTPVDPEVLAPWVEVQDLGYHSSRATRFAKLSDWLRKNAHRFDVLLLYQLTIESTVYAHIYKEIRPDGICVLKLDMDERSAAMLTTRTSPKAKFNDRLFAASPIDFFTIETSTLLKTVQPYFDRIGKPIHLFANGFSLKDEWIDRPKPRKENVILCVARLGMPQKNIEGLVQAFAAISPQERASWRLDLVGSVEGDFAKWLAHQKLSDDIRLVGQLTDRSVLFEHFERAAIFALSSRWESFGLVLVEAAVARCFIVSTDVGAARDITDDGRLGEIVAVENDSAMTLALHRAMTRLDRESVGTELRANALERFSWPNLCQNLVGFFESYRVRTTNIKNTESK